MPDDLGFLVSFLHFRLHVRLGFGAGGLVGWRDDDCRVQYLELTFDPYGPASLLRQWLNARCPGGKVEPVGLPYAGIKGCPLQFGAGCTDLNVTVASRPQIRLQVFSGPLNIATLPDDKVKPLASEAGQILSGVVVGDVT